MPSGINATCAAIASHGLPFPENLKVSELADEFGVSHSMLANRLLEEQEVRVRPGERVTRPIADAALALYGLEPLPESDLAAGIDLPRISHAYGIPAGDIIACAYRDCRAFIPSNRRLSLDELRSVERVLGHSIDVDRLQREQIDELSLRSRMLLAAIRAIGRRETSPALERAELAFVAATSASAELQSAAQRALTTHDFSDVIRACQVLPRFAEPLRTGLAEAGLTILLSSPAYFQRHAAEWVYWELGEIAAESMLKRSLETGNDELATGVGYGWLAAYDLAFWSLRQYPREHPRLGLTCLLRFDEDEMWTTRLDPRLTLRGREELRTRFLPILMLDRGKEVRRRARVADVLAQLPPNSTVPFKPGMRGLRQDLARFDQLKTAGRGDEFEFMDPQDNSTMSEALATEFRRLRESDGSPTDSFVCAALDFVTDWGQSGDERDIVASWLFSGRRLSAQQLCVIAEAAAADADTLAELAEHENADAEVFVTALRGAPTNLALLGKVLSSRRLRDHPSLAPMLVESANPHVLYALVKGRVGGVAQRAFDALVREDPDRALLLVEDQPGRGAKLRVSYEAWARLVDHPHPRIRERAWQQRREGGIRVGKG